MGRPIHIERCGKIKSEKIFDVISDEDFWKFNVQQMEKIVKSHYMVCSLVAQQQVFQTFTIIDL